ncbi:hypothetical protein [Chitinophaga barathri]|uniref:Uncharacterized protein n=1 Tax=Chitinophaga barathri TaxID=1647451 RepID=A0A3N4MH59_9BACT|nr:hypothetical protein [Chitinophaga barathri]RPD39430.1 hypothetical protein EG028_20120 [Chitinophaga barathri]
MHENQLRFFEDLMFRNVSTESAPPGGFKKPHDNFNVSEIEREKSAVLQYLRELRFHMPSEERLAWAIDTYFGRVIDLLNRAYKYIENGVTKNRQSYAKVFAALQEILSFLEQRYGRYMDVNTCLPISHEMQLKDALIEGFFFFKTSAENANISPALVEIIESVFADFVETEEFGKTSYGRIYYLSALITALGKLSPMTDEAIQHTLIALNFNCPAFVKHFTQNLPEDPGVLVFILKEVNQISAAPGFALNPLYTTVKEQLSAWLNHEIGYLAGSSANVAPPPVMKDAAPVRKIMTTLSVPQLAHMLKLFTDLGIIVHDNKTELLEAFAAMFRTGKTDNISPESLRNNYYGENASVSSSVRDIFVAVINKSKGII